MTEDNDTIEICLTTAIAACATYLTIHYARKAWQNRQERRRAAIVEAQIAKVNATLNEIANMFPPEFNL